MYRVPNGLYQKNLFGGGCISTWIAILILKLQSNIINKRQNGNMFLYKAPYMCTNVFDFHCPYTQLQYSNLGSYKPFVFHVNPLASHLTNPGL